MHKLITIDVNGIPTPLYGLKKKYNNWRHDYSEEFIQGLIAGHKKGDAKSTESLIFLNAYCLAEYSNNFSGFESIGIVVSDSMKRNFYDNNNSFQRDVLNKNFPQHLSSDTEYEDDGSSIGTLATAMCEAKKKIRKSGKSITEIRDSPFKRSHKKVPHLPVKTLDKTEIEAYKKTYKTPAKNVPKSEVSTDSLVRTLSEMRVKLRNQGDEKAE